ncbi:MAG: NapC/NirT family cytochrome c [Acidiferrobacterales bacterium]
MSWFGNLWRSLTTYCTGHCAAILYTAVGMLLLVVIVFSGEAALSTTAFCTTCHSMSYPAKELKKSSHWGALGVDPECRDCHIPQGLSNFHLAVLEHVVSGTRDLIHEFTGDYSTVKKFNKRRLKMAHFARLRMKARDSLTCRACHKNTRPPGKSPKAAHKKMETEGATCIDCHQNLVHKEVDETDLDASLAQGKMVIREEE